MPQAQFDAGELRLFATAALRQAGLPREPAEVVAEGLVEADLLGHSTHGLALLGDYVDELQAGTMTATGRPEVVSSLGAVATWDARKLPGVWTTVLAIEEATRLASTLGMGAVALRRSHHIACLASFLEAPARRGFLTLVFSSDPGEAHVVPFGGVTPVLMPDPIAAGIPDRPDPILIDISTSITTMGMSNRARREGAKLPGRWLQDAAGRPTDDPTDLGKGTTLLPVGGADHGHKGYALGLLVEALTQGLGGHGRRDQPGGWGAAVLVLAFNPAAFGGLEGFLDQVQFLSDACRAARPVPGGAPVRLPGEAGLARKRAALRDGLELRTDILAGLTALAGRFSLVLPQPR